MYGIGIADALGALSAPRTLTIRGGGDNTISTTSYDITVSGAGYSPVERV